MSAEDLPPVKPKADPLDALPPLVAMLVRFFLPLSGASTSFHTVAQWLAILALFAGCGEYRGWLVRMVAGGVPLPAASAQVNPRAGIPEDMIGRTDIPNI